MLATKVYMATSPTLPHAASKKECWLAN